MEVKNNSENRVDLATAIVDSWDLETLCQFAQDRLAEDYKHNSDVFADDWEEWMVDRDEVLDK